MPTKISKRGPIKPGEVAMPPIAKLPAIKVKTPDLCKGMRLRYKGDDVPYVDTSAGNSFLIKKGEKEGKFLLPAFMPEEPDGKREWFDSPGSTDSEYHIERIETGRIGKPTKKHPDGRPLEDIVVICSPAYRARFGLSRTNVLAKFDVVGIPQEEVVIDEETLAAQQERMSWAEATMEGGW